MIFFRLVPQWFLLQIPPLIQHSLLVYIIVGWPHPNCQGGPVNKRNLWCLFAHCPHYNDRKRSLFSSKMHKFENAAQIGDIWKRSPNVIVWTAKFTCACIKNGCGVFFIACLIFLTFYCGRGNNFETIIWTRIFWSGLVQQRIIKIASLWKDASGKIFAPLKEIDAFLRSHVLCCDRYILGVTNITFFIAILNILILAFSV